MNNHFFLALPWHLETNFFPRFRLLKRVVSEPGAIYIPPPPPPPLPDININISTPLSTDSKYPRQIEPASVRTSVTVESISSSKTGASTILLRGDDSNSEISHFSSQQQSGEYSSSPSKYGLIVKCWRNSKLSPWLPFAMFSAIEFGM